MSTALAQPAANQGSLPALSGGTDDGELRCWWKSDRTAVHVGERFQLTLTCRVLETNTERIAPDERLLEAVQRLGALG